MKFATDVDWVQLGYAFGLGVLIGLLLAMIGAALSRAARRARSRRRPVPRRAVTTKGRRTR